MPLAILPILESETFSISDLIPTVVTLAISCALVLATRRLLDRRSRDRNGFSAQIILLSLVLACLLAVIISLPLEPSESNSLLQFVGILLSAAIALASTTLLGNAMAGLMLRAVRNFKVGDFILVEGQFGRVTERRLVHTEIQTEDRDLTTLPNLFLVTHPVKVLRASGTVISATVSLGYDVPRAHIQDLMLRAAEKAMLVDGFVQVQDLGDYSVTYRVGGLLKEVRQVLSSRSRLRKCLLDSLHSGGIEIVSPTFMNTRKTDQQSFIPQPIAIRKESSIPEHVVFDKADKKASIESQRERLAGLEKKLEGLRAELAESEDDGDRPAIEDEIKRLELRTEAIEREIQRREAEGDEP